MIQVLHAPFVFLCAFLLSDLATWALAGDATEPVTIYLERPTLHSLGFEWPIQGDDNRNATVRVSYRKAGLGRWREALPLLRIGGEKEGKIGWASLKWNFQPLEFPDLKAFTTETGLEEHAIRIDYDVFN